MHRSPQINRQWRTELNFRYVSRVEAIDENLVRLAPIVMETNVLPVKLWMPA